MKKASLPWLVGAAILTVIFGTIYGVGQQVLRMGANDPQIQMAEDISTQINKGVDPKTLVTNEVDLINNTPFVIIYDKSGNELASSGKLYGVTPSVPFGVLEHAKPYNAITWEPLPLIRTALVVMATNDGYVAVGRNIREFEKRETIIFRLVGVGWLAAEIGLLITGLYVIRRKSDDKKTKK